MATSEANTQRQLAKNSDAEVSAVDQNSTFCTFYLNDRCFGLDTRLVGEVVTVEEAISIPLSAAAVRGMFSLRGEPVPLVSLHALLGLAEPNNHKPSNKALTAMVVRSGDLVLAFPVDRMHAVLARGQGEFRPPSSLAEDAVSEGFLEVQGERHTTMINILEPTKLLERVNALRFFKLPEN